MSKLIDLTGKRYGRLTVIERAEDYVSPRGQHVTMWRCKCDCGNEAIVAGGRLRNGHTRSCSCLVAETTKLRSTTHGKSKCRLYGIWNKMIQRCTNKNSDSYMFYGGRGISVCDDWRKYEAFEKWAMEAGFDPGAARSEYSLERRNPNGDYHPENCCWIRLNQQARNTRKSRYLTIEGETRLLIEWCELHKQRYETVMARIDKLKWEPVEALGITPRLKNSRRRYLTIDGETKSLIEWCEQYSINDSVVRARLQLGWNPEIALSTPLGLKKGGTKGNMIEINGEKKNISAWCRQYGVPSSTFRNRLKAGLSPEEALGIVPRKK